MLKKGNLLVISTFLTILITLFLFFFSCASNSSQKNGFAIYTSIEPIRFLIDNLTGGEIATQTLIKPGADPHTFEISASQLSEILKAKAYFSIDIPFELTMIDKIKKQNKNFKVYKLYENSKPDEDIHIWLSINKIKEISGKILNSLIELYPDKKDIFNQNYNILINKLNGLNDTLKFNIESSNIKSFLVFHPSLTYFAADYGLNQISIENEGKVPSGNYLIDVNKRIKEDKISFIIVQPEFPVEQISQFVKDNKLDVVTVDILNYNLFDTLIKISEIFVKYRK
jgi:zinc transport system substrate-binding protein